MKKTDIIGLICFSLIVLTIVLAVLVFVPITRNISYQMHGYIVHTDGRILEEFDFTVTGKEYEFMIDRPGGGTHFTGNKLTGVSIDTTILYPQWDAYTFTSLADWYYMQFPDTQELNNSCHMGFLHFFKADASRTGADSVLLDMDNGTLCVYAKQLMGNAFIVGVTEEQTTPESVIAAYRELILLPED